MRDRGDDRRWGGVVGRPTPLLPRPQSRESLTALQWSCWGPGLYVVVPRAGFANTRCGAGVHDGRAHTRAKTPLLLHPGST